jgi:hypothetical protein
MSTERHHAQVPSVSFGGISETAPLSVHNDPIVVNQHIVPLVKVREREGAWRFWDEIPIKRIAVDYFSLKKTPIVYRRATEVGIHAALGFPGEVTAILVGRDWELDNLDVTSYAQVVQRMGFDSATTPDDYTYVDDQPTYRMQRILVALARARKMIAEAGQVKVIGTVKGANRAEIDFSLDRLKSFGINTMVFPCSEYMEAKRYFEPRMFVRLSRDKGLTSWIVGANSLKAIRKLGADHYSGSGWCYGAASRLIYGANGWVKALDRFACRHAECKLAQELLPPGVSKARHNIRRLLEEDSLLSGRDALG